MQVSDQVSLWARVEGTHRVYVAEVIFVFKSLWHCWYKQFVWFQLDKQQFEETIQTLNNLYAEAEKLGGKSYLEGFLACMTAYTIFLCMETHYEKVASD